MSKDIFQILITENGKELGKLTVELFRSSYQVPKMVSLPEAIKKFNQDNSKDKLEAKLLIKGR